MAPHDATSLVSLRPGKHWLQGLISKIPRTRHWRVTDDGRKVMGTAMYLRELHIPDVYAAVTH